jgi:hypothetical protein
MDGIAELPAEPPSKPARKPLPHAFTRENAAEFTKKGLIARAANRKARLEKLAISADPYVNERLSRVRAQLERIDSMMEEELDPQRLDRLASAQARLSAQEFALAGRPQPGSRRPGRERPSKDKASSGPTDAE